MTKLKAILAAAALTGTTLVAVLVLNFPSLSTLTGGSQAGSAVEAAPTEIDPEYAQALADRQAQLEDAQSLMADRQTNYEDQIDAAQQVIADLEAQIEDVQAQMEAEQATLPDLQAEYQSASGYSWQNRQQRDALAAQEAEYAAQLDAANQTILALQAQINQMAGN